VDRVAKPSRISRLCSSRRTVVVAARAVSSVEDAVAQRGGEGGPGG
jgi:hypothetical protein